MFKVVDHLATSGFSDPAGRACAPSPGTVPELKTCRSLLSGGYCQQTHAQNIRAAGEVSREIATVKESVQLSWTKGRAVKKVPITLETVGGFRWIYMASHALHEWLDKLVPWVAFGYGCIMIFVFQQPALVKLAQTRIPEPHRSRFLSHMPLAWICLFAGGLWILQDLWV